MNEKSQVPSAPMVGLHDRKLDGWAVTETGEIAPGVPIKPGMQVVDVGCGDGGHAGFCARMGADLTYIDIQEEKVSALDRVFAQGQFEGELKGIVSECQPIPLPDNYADVVMSTEVLEHVDAPADFLREIARIGKADATFLLTVPDARGERLIEATAPDIYFQHPNHIQVFSDSDFRNLVESCGLEVVRHEFLGAFWALFFLFKWASSDDESAINEASHPMTRHWTATWSAVLNHPKCKEIRESLNNAIPSSQVIIARKRREL